MKKLALAVAAAAFLSVPAFADGLSNAFGNTVRVSAGDQSFDAYFDADGSYSDNRGISGSWSYDGQLCLTVDAGEGPQTNCGPWNEDLAVGASWSTDGWSNDGSTLTVELISGR